MKKVKGKALSLVLSLALVISSFSAIPASAATKTLSGSLGGNDNDSIYLVNGGATDAALTYKSFGTYVSDDPTMTTPNHKDVSDVHIAAVSHKSGDRLVKWFDAGSQHDKEDSISEDTIDKNVDLQLRSATVSGTEVISLLYKGTYTDDDDNEYTVKATQDVTVRVYNADEAVIGEYGDAGTSNSKGELDSSFAQKTVAYETATPDSNGDKDPTLTDKKELTVLQAGSDPTNPVVVKWTSLKTVSENDANADAYLDDDNTISSDDETYYVLKSNSGNVVLGNGDQALSFSNESDPSATQPGLKLKVVNGAKTDTVVVSDPLNDYTFKYSVTPDGEAEGTKAAVTGGKIDVSALDDGDTVKVYAYDGDDQVGTAASFTVVAASDASLTADSSETVETTANDCDETNGIKAEWDATSSKMKLTVPSDATAATCKIGSAEATDVEDGDTITVANNDVITLTCTATDGTVYTNVYKYASDDNSFAKTSKTVTTAASTENADGATAAYDATEDGDAANVVVTDHSATNVKYAWGDDDLAAVVGGKIAIAGKADGTLTIQSTAAGKTITNVYTFTAATTDKTARSVDSVPNYVKLSKNTDGDVVVSNDAATGYALTYSVNNVDKGAVSGKEITGLHNGDTLKVTATKGDTVLTTSGIFRAYAGDSSDFVTAQVDTKAGTGNVTFTAEATPYAETQVDADALYSASDIKVKSSVDKKILVGNSNYTTFSKYSTSTYLYTGPVDSKTKDDGVKVTGYEVNFNNGGTNGAKVTVDDKANVTKISGTVHSISIADGNVGSISLSDTAEQSITVSDAKVGDIDFGSNGGTLEVNSTDSIVGNVTDASKVTVTNGTVGDIDADEADISAEDEDGTVKVGNVTAPIIGVDSDNSKVATGTLKATSDDTEITLSGDFVTVAGVDFDNWGAELKIDGFTGTVPAPKNATEDGATISTNATEDKVTIDGDADINSIAIGDDSQMIFNGKLNVGSVDGSGTLVVGLGKMDISSDASGVTLKFSDPTINVGDTAFTAVTDTVDVDSMEPYGCTLSMTEGSKEDTFKIASTDFVGMTFNPSSARIANGYSQTFAASTYAPGTALPEGYSVQYTLDGDDDIFQMTNNDDGTVTVKVVGYDDTFAEENTATLRAEVVDTDGDVDDDYSAGELDLTALAVPDSTFKSDTGSTLSIGGGFTYQFAITSLDGNVPYFAVAGNSFKTTYVGNSGNTYYYKVTAVGKVGDAAGVYINHGATPSTVITITNPSDTAAVTVKAGGSYQFRVNGPSQPVFQVAGIGNIALTSKAGSNYYFKVNVPTNLAKGGHGVYNNGVLVAILTVA